MLLLLTLASLLQVEKKADLEKTKLFVYDADKGMTLRIRDDGRVELALKEEKGEKTFLADSAEDFEKKFPEVAKKNGLRKYFHPDGAPGQNELEKWWGELRQNRRLMPELPEFGVPLDEDIERFFQEQKKMMEELRRRFRSGEAPAPAPAPEGPKGGREFGIKIDGVGETLRDQLSLKEGEGVLVGEVKPGSVAEKAGIQQHDIILKVDGKAAGDKWEFRKDVLRALEKGDFDVEILRGGKRQTLKAKPAGKKDE